MISYRSIQKNSTFNTHALHIFVNEISSPTYTTLYLIILCSFSSDIASNLTMTIRAETCSWDIYMYLTV